MKKIALISVLIILLMSCTSVWSSGSSETGVAIHGLPQQSIMQVIFPDNSAQEFTINTTAISIEKSQNDAINQIFLKARKNPIEIHYELIDSSGSRIIQAKINALFRAVLGSQSKEFSVYSWELINMKYHNQDTVDSMISFNDFITKFPLPYVLMDSNANKNTNMTMRYARTSSSKVGQSGIKNIVYCLLKNNQYIDYIIPNGKVLAEIQEKGLVLFEGSEPYTNEIIEYSSIIFTLRDWVPKMVDMLGYNE